MDEQKAAMPPAGPGAATAQPELNLGIKAATPEAQAAPATAPESVAGAPAPIATGILPTPSPAPATDSKPKPKAKPSADPSEVKKLAAEAEEMRAEAEKMRAKLGDLEDNIKRGHESRRLQIIRGAGVEALSDVEILQLAPSVDPSTPKGIAEINAWIEAHPTLVAPRYRVASTKTDHIVENAMKHKAVHTLGGAEWVRDTLRNLYPGDKP